MPERLFPQEAQKPPMIQAVEETRSFFEKVEESDNFKEASKSVLRKLGNISPESQDAAKNMVKSGAGAAINIVGLLPAFANEEKRKEILEEFKKNKTEGAWVDVLANWNVNEDPNGIGVLNECKRLSIEEILEKKAEVQDEKQREQIQIQVEAVTKGQDLIINKYKESLKQASKKAA